MHTTGDPFRGEDCAQRQAARQRLRDRDYIRQNIVMLIGKMAPGAAQAALNLVKNEQRTALFGQSRGEVEKFFINRTDPSFTLNRLNADRADTGIKLSLEIVEVVELYEGHAGQQWNKRSTIFRLTGRSQRTEGASVKRIIHRQDANLRF